MMNPYERNIMQIKKIARKIKTKLSDPEERLRIGYYTFGAVVGASAMWAYYTKLGTADLLVLRRDQRKWLREEPGRLIDYKSPNGERYGLLDMIHIGE